MRQKLTNIMAGVAGLLAAVVLLSPFGAGLGAQAVQSVLLYVGSAVNPTALTATNGRLNVTNALPTSCTGTYTGPFANSTTSTGECVNGSAIVTTTSSAVTSTAHLLFSADNTYDIGASGATRPRNGYFGGEVIAGGMYTGAYAVSNAAGRFSWDGRASLYSTADGIVQATNAAGTGFTRLILGTNDASGAAVAKNGTTLQAVTGDASVFAPWQSLYQRFGAGSPEGVITAPVGAIYNRSDGGAGTSFYVKESGAGNTGWVAK